MASSSCSNEEEELSLAIELAMGSVLPMTLRAAIELGVFDIIGPEAKLCSSEIASQLGTKNPDAPIMLDRILRLLASHSLLTCYVVGDRTLYGFAPLSKYFSPNQDGVSLAPFTALIQDKVFLDSWYELKDCVLNGGIPFNKAHGVHAFEYPAMNPRFNRVFNDAMVSHTTIHTLSMLEKYKGFEHLKKVVDVGGGTGVTLHLITTKYPFLKAINYDLPHVINQAPIYHGVEHVGGDMFESVPKGDAVFMRWVLHDWNDEHCIKLLKNCYKSIPGDGKVIVIEHIVPEDNIGSSDTSVKNVFKLDMLMMTQNPGGKERTQDEFLDMLMMTQNPGGKERTQDEFMALALSAGFSGITFVCSVCNYCVMEFFK